MSSFDSMTPLESDLQPPVHSDVHVPSPFLGGFLRHNLLMHAAKFSFQASSNAGVLPPAQFTPWLASLAYPVGRYGLLPAYFREIEVIGQENIPLSGPVILAPTHRSRWDAFVIPYAAGHDITGRHLHFMVSADEVVGCQGWLIRHLGGFPVNTKRPTISSLRYGIELLRKHEVLVIFPEGDIFRGRDIQPLKPGLARLALQAEANQPDLDTRIVPIHIHYNQPTVPWKSRVKIQIGTPLRVADYNLGSPKNDAQLLTCGLFRSLKSLEERV
ncbi:lysophospholipid acyltransferase family protein [Leptothermofonsia sichuanensis]|uniref:lysophospholipid acyltransferase family protein n=1 Tax=Leptothermofonsia sichuanensis TaxID=2917832 RepID=UPI001CEE0335|nr:lysophospholipid acyltransferase family protein [Leptothermofonsia sichuanensis]